MGLDVTRGNPKTHGALVQMAVDMDMLKFPALEAGLMITGVVVGKGHIVVAAISSDFCVSDGGFFLFSQKG